MSDSLFPWIIVGVAAVVDVVGLFYLWRRRNSRAGANHRVASGAARALCIPLAERRRKERRGTSRTAAV